MEFQKTASVKCLVLFRIEWVWRERLKAEEEEVETMQGINRILLENLLPAHVAQHYLAVLQVNETIKKNIFFFAHPLLRKLPGLWGGGALFSTI